MKKTEMEGHSADYEGLMAQAQQAQRKGLYRKAVELALAAGQHIDGMMQYEQKYANREFLSIPAIELVLRSQDCPPNFPDCDVRDHHRLQPNDSLCHGSLIGAKHEAVDPTVSFY